MTWDPGIAQNIFAAKPLGKLKLLAGIWFGYIWGLFNCGWLPPKEGGIFVGSPVCGSYLV